MIHDIFFHQMSQIGDQKSPRLEKSDRESILARLMMSTLAQLPLYHPRTMTLLATLVDQLERYHLILGRNIKENSQLLRKLLEDRAIGI